MAARGSWPRVGQCGPGGVPCSAVCLGGLAPLSPANCCSATRSETAASAGRPSLHPSVEVEKPRFPASQAASRVVWRGLPYVEAPTCDTRTGE